MGLNLLYNLLSKRKARKQAVIYFIDQRVIIHAQSLAKSGFWISDDPFLNLPIGVSQEEIINNLVDTANKSRKDLPDPKNWKDFEAKYLSKLGLKSWRDPSIQYLKVIRFKIEDGFLKFIPTKADPHNPGGFFDLEEKTSCINASAPITEKIHMLEISLQKCV